MKFKEITLFQKIIVIFIHIVFLAIPSFLIYSFGFKGLNLSNLSQENYWMIIMFISLLWGLIYFKKIKADFFRSVIGKVLTLVICVLLLILLLLTGVFGFVEYVSVIALMFIFLLWKELGATSNASSVGKILLKHAVFLGIVIGLLGFVIMLWISAIASIT